MANKNSEFQLDAKSETQKRIEMIRVGLCTIQYWL